MSFGTNSNTYTMGGITSQASKDAQTGPLEVVTTDANGNLASDGGAFQRQIDSLGKRDSELAGGIAIALAIQQPIFHDGQTYAMRLGYGNFDGSNALGLSMAGVLDKGSFGDKSSITLDTGLGFGTETGTVAGKAGVTFGW
jgi:trimeric autotransporter adhesin